MLRNFFKYFSLFTYVFVLVFFLSIFFIRFKDIKMPNYSYRYDSKKLNRNNISIMNQITFEALPTPIPTQTFPDPSLIPKYRTIDYINFPISKSKSIGQFVPDDLVVLNRSYANANISVSKLIVSDLEKMIKDASADGLDLFVSSGYRSYSTQNYLFNNYVNQELKANPGITYDEAVPKVNNYSAKPGHSEHQLGTTIDLVAKQTDYKFTSDPNSLFVQWIEKNAIRYNFTISYPKGNTEYIYEPWHLRWRGPA